MKANPDYKWHSSEKLPQPVKMSTRPTNARASQSVSKLEHPLHGSTLGSLAGLKFKMRHLSRLKLI